MNRTPSRSAEKSRRRPRYDPISSPPPPSTLEEMDPRTTMDGLGYDISAFAAQQPPQIFGAYNHDGSPMPPMLSQGAYFGDGLDGLDDSDPKRRRIARVRTVLCDRRSITDSQLAGL